MSEPKADFIWMDGKLVPWDEANVHVLTHALHYGTGVFEGVRCYDTQIGPAIFRHPEHVNRLFQSASMYYMDVPYTQEQIRLATLETIRANNFQHCYVRPLIYRGEGPRGLNPLDVEVRVVIACWEWGSYLGDDGKENGVRAKVSSWRRISPQSLIPHAKASGQYLNSVLAKIETVKAGYQEAILLDEHGYVCEGSGENIFIVRDGVIFTPPQTASILDGITRRSIMQMASDEGYELVERNIARSELYLADEMFVVGTAAELTPVREVDDHAVGTGKPGEVTKRLQTVFEDAIRGRDPRYLDWLDPVNGGA